MKWEKLLLVLGAKVLDVTGEDVATAIVLDSEVDCVVPVVVVAGPLVVPTAVGKGIMQTVRATPAMQPYWIQEMRN